MTGKVATAAGEDLEVTVDQVRQWPGGRKVKQAGQKVPITRARDGVDRGHRRPARGTAYPALELLTGDSRHRLDVAGHGDARPPSSAPRARSPRPASSLKP